MTQAAKAQEPSMEEILASIRRIIADDDAGKAVRATEPPTPKPAPPPVSVVAGRSAPPPRPPALPPAPPRAAPAPAPARVATQDEVDAVIAGVEADTAPATPEVPPPAPKKMAAAAPDVLDLTEAMAAPPPAAPAPSFRTIDGGSDIIFAERGPEPAARPVEEPRPQPAPLSMADGALISASTRAAVDSAFHSLAHTVLGQNARTLEDLVKEMLRPLLKAWLDDNLPSLVERIVRAEIERVSRGR